MPRPAPRADGPVVASAALRAMGCATVVTVVGPDGGTAGDAAELLAAARRRIAQLEQLWSRFIVTSDITRINTSGGHPVAVDPATVTLVTRMVEAWRATDGAFDPTLLGALAALGYAASWDDPSRVSLISPGSAWRGAPAEILVDPASSVVLSPAGTTLDPGGIGKGLAADLVAAEAMAGGAAGVLVSIGGDLRVQGRAPQDGGWAIDVAAAGADRNPARDTADQLRLLDGGVATSGIAERSWRTADGHDVHHLLDPRHGTPTPSGAGSVVSATVVAGTAAWAEVFTKAAIIDWPAWRARLDAAGLAASVVRAGGRRETNDTWAQFAATTPDPTEDAA